MIPRVISHWTEHSLLKNAFVCLIMGLLWLHGIIEVTGGYYGKIPAFAISGTLFS